MTDQTTLSSAGEIPISRPEGDISAGPRQPHRFVVAALAWIGAGAATLLLQDVEDLAGSRLTGDFGVVQVVVGLLFLVALPLWHRIGGVGRWIHHNAWRLAGLAAFLALWQIASGKTGYWPQPYIPAPQGVVDVFITDYARLFESVRASLVVLGLGAGIGILSGFLTGLATGWTPRVGYWTRPFLRLFGPIPATSLIPIALFMFPTSFSASIFLVALATWFPVAVLTWSGVESVEEDYYDVARTLGASTLFLLFRVAIPASLPHVFVGIFMGLGASLSVLVVAEMVGVQAGLGYYLDWSQSWAAYANLFAGLFIMAILFSLLTTALFRIRDKVLVGRKGDVQW